LPKESEAVLLGAAVLGAVASGDHLKVLDAMGAMNGVSRIIQPGIGRIARYHAAKYRVFHRMHEDFFAYRKLMGPVR
jgi:ribulose kinase